MLSSRRTGVVYISGMRLSVGLLAALLAAGCALGGKGGGEAAPASFVRSTADARMTRVVEVRDGLSHSQAMRTVADALSQHYVVEVQDQRAGFSMTSWQASLLRDGVPDLRYRTRLTAKFLGDDWRRLQVRSEANWAHGEEWEVGFDAAQLDSVTADLRARLAKRP